MKRNEIAITTPFIKLDSFLKLAGAAATGGEAKHWIINGEVLVDGAVCQMRGKKLIPGSVVTVNGEEFEVVQK